MLSNDEKKVLEILLIDRLEHNWNMCDKLTTAHPMYHLFTDECRTIKSIAENLKIDFPNHIKNRLI